MKKSIVAVMAILVLLVSLLCACKRDDTKTNADTTGDAQTSAAGDVVDDTRARQTKLNRLTPQSPARPLRIR